MRFGPLAEKKDVCEEVPLYTLSLSLFLLEGNLEKKKSSPL